MAHSDSLITVIRIALARQIAAPKPLPICILITPQPRGQRVIVRQAGRSEPSYAKGGISSVIYVHVIRRTLSTVRNMHTKSSISVYQIANGSIGPERADKFSTYSISCQQKIDSIFRLPSPRYSGERVGGDGQKRRWGQNQPGQGKLNNGAGTRLALADAAGCERNYCFPQNPLQDS